MCEICKNINKGEHQGLVFDTVKATNGNGAIDEQELSIYIGRDDDGDYMLSGRYYAEDGSKLVTKVSVLIKYCPFCGRKLRHKARFTYPWEA